MTHLNHITKIRNLIDSLLARADGDAFTFNEEVEIIEVEDSLHKLEVYFQNIEAMKRARYKRDLELMEQIEQEVRQTA